MELRSDETRIVIVADAQDVADAEEERSGKKRMEKGVGKERKRIERQRDRRGRIRWEREREGDIYKGIVRD